MNKLLDAYTAATNTAGRGEHIEFELRIAIASLNEYKATFIGIAKVARLATISRTINIIKESSSVKSKGAPRINQIATQSYIERNGTVIKDGAITYGIKRAVESLSITTEFVPYKISIAAEATAEKFATDPFKQIRIKLRISLTVEQFANWRFDFTLVCEMTSVADLAKKREMLFIPGITVENFADIAPFERADMREFEIEWIGSGPIEVSEIHKLLDFIHDAGGFKYTQTAEYQVAIFDVAKLLFAPGKAEAFRSRQGLKHLVSPPISLNRATYFAEVLPNITRYVATIKADGVGIVGHITGNTINIIGGELTTATIATTHAKSTIYLAELIGKKQYVFDVYMFDGQLLLGTAEIAVRIKYIPQVIAMINDGMTNGPTAQTKEYISFTTEYATELKRLWEHKYEFPVDGIIFGDAFKWKPLEKVTIDFLTMRAPTSVLGRPPHIAKPDHELYFLFCGINKNQSAKFRIHNAPGYGEIFRGRTFYDYYPIQFAPPNAPTAYLYYHPIGSPITEIHGRICEYKWADGRWHIERIRTDRDVEVARGSYFGNGIAVANANWDIIQDPLTFDMLRSAPEEADGQASYFGKTDEMYKSANMFSSFVKNHSLRAFKNLVWVVDLAAGRGADLPRLGRNNIRNVLCVDNDANALKTLISRQEGMQRMAGHFKTVVYTHQANLNDDYKTTIADIRKIFPVLPDDGAPLVICNMAIHYMCESDLTINNFVMLVDHLCAVGGHFVFTCYNGARVFELLGDKERLDYYDEPSLKYSIIRDFPAGSKLHNFGQTIRPLLGCAGGNYVSEFLVNIDYIVRVFKSRGFKLIEQASFDSLLEEYSIDNLDAYDTLTDADFSHLRLYDYVILQKTKSVADHSEIASSTTEITVGETKQPYVVPYTPALQHKFESAIDVNVATVLPTKEIKLSITVGDVMAAAIRDGSRDLIVLPNDKQYKLVAIGWRIEIGAAFEVVVEEVHRFATFGELWAAFDVSRVGAKSSAEFESAFLSAAGLKRLTKAGLIAMRVKKL